MGEYTSSLSNKGCDISPEDENYKQELLDVVKSFRTFDAALDEFIVQKGYSGDIADIDAKVKFIKEQFDRAGGLGAGTNVSIRITSAARLRTNGFCSYPTSTRWSV